jgi:hypothetical protein
MLNNFEKLMIDVYLSTAHHHGRLMARGQPSSAMAKPWHGVTSEWSAQQITEAIWIALTEGLEPPQVEHPQYNICHCE